MGLTQQEREELNAFLKKYREHPKVMEMKNYIQHGAITTYEHCECVTELCFLINRRWRLGADERKLIRTAFLHDFYLYDWHDPDPAHRLHGYFHPEKSSRNAKKYFDLSEDDLKVIRSHMWPLTLRSVPTSREAWILCLVDKYVSTIETVGKRKRLTVEG